jgi:UDP-2-acetamido-2-deoxy-ribo-hexuluronate aminotransferase
LDNNIPNAIYYPVPLHSQKAYADSRYNEDDFKVTNELIETVVSLPMHTEFEEDQQEFITQTILNFLK